MPIAPIAPDAAHCTANNRAASRFFQRLGHFNTGSERKHCACRAQGMPQIVAADEDGWASGRHHGYMNPAPQASVFDLHIDADVATLSFTLAQPKNAFRSADALQLGACLREAQELGARCLVLRGTERVFSAGWDIGSIDSNANDPMAMIEEIVAPLCRCLRELHMPTIAAVAGPALGFGFGLAMCCDIVLAEETALLGSPFRHIGMVPDTGTHHVLLSRLGYGRAAELIYTGRLLSGCEAAESQLVNRAVAVGTVAAEADAMARQIASGPTVALNLSKQILQAGGRFEEMMAREAEALKTCFGTADLREGMSAFMQKRAPVFKGR